MNKKINFLKIDKVSNPNSIHGIYPYRGKISSLDAISIIEQLPSDGTFLDPFCGSGTIVYEARKHGLNAYGVDNNPLAITIAKSKLYYDDIEKIEKECVKIIDKARIDLINNNYKAMPESALRSFHNDTAKEIMTVKNYFSKMNDYIKGAFYGAIALTARGCNGYKWTSTTVGKNIEPKTYICFYDKFLDKVKKHSKYLISNNSEFNIYKSDSRKLTDIFEPKSVDYVFTSPPYFDCLDYTAYYGKLIYDIFETNRVSIKKQLIQKFDTYKKDMSKVLSELDIITKDNSIIIFVVGDKKVSNGIINGGEFFNEIMKTSYVTERSYSGSSSKVFDVLNNTQRKEQIVVWQKKNGKVVEYEK